MVKKAILTIWLTVALLMMVAPGAMASYQAQTVGGYGPYQTGSGGEFTLFVNSDLASVLGSYATTTTNQYNVPGYTPNIQTFCVEESEYIYPNATYNVTIGQTTQYSGHQLTNGAAWLYSEFATGDLMNYGYNYSISGRANLATGTGNNNALQEAIWYYMGEGPNNATNKFIMAAESHFQSQNGNSLGYSNGAFGVAIMNLWDSTSGGARQDQLVYVGVPEPFTLLFLGGCLFGAGMAGRKFKI